MNFAFTHDISVSQLIPWFLCTTYYPEVASCAAAPAAHSISVQSCGAGANSQNSGITAQVKIGQPMLEFLPRSGVYRFCLGCRVTIPKIKHILGFLCFR